MSDSKHELNLEEIGKEEEAYGQFESLDTREALKHRGKRGYRILRHVDTARTSDDEKLLQTILTDIHQIRNELDHLRTENSEEETFNDKPEKSPLADTPQNKLFSLNTESEVLTVDDEPAREQDAQSEEIKLSNNIEEVHIEPVDSVELQMTEANMQKMGMLDSDELREFDLDSLAMPHHERFNDVDIDIPVDNYPADLEAEASVTASLSKIAYENKTSGDKEKAEEEQSDIRASADEQESIEIAVPLESLARKDEPSQEIVVQENISQDAASAQEDEIDPLDAVLPPPDIQPSAPQREEARNEEELSAEESVMASLMKAAENAAVAQQKEADIAPEEPAAGKENKRRSEEDILSEFDFSDLEGPVAKFNGAAVGDSSADILGEENLSQIILENDSIVSTELTSLPSSEKLVELLQRPIESVSSDDLNVVIPVGPMFDGDLSSIASAGQNIPVRGEEETYAVVQEAEALDETALEAVAEAEIESVDEIVEPAEEQPEIVESEEAEESAEESLSEQEDEEEAQPDIESIEAEEDTEDINDAEEEEEPVLEADFVEAEETDAPEEEEEEPEHEESVSSEGNFAELEEEIIEEEAQPDIESIEAEEAAEESSSEQEEEEEAQPDIESTEAEETAEESSSEQEEEEEAQPDVENIEAEETAEESSSEEEPQEEIEAVAEEPVSPREEGDLDAQETEAALEEIEENGLSQADTNIPEAEDPEIVNEIADEVLSKDVLDALEKASQMHASPSSVSSSGATQFSYDQDLFSDLEGFIGFFENIFAKIPQDEQMRLAETLGYAAYLRVKSKVEKESLRQVTSSMLDSLTLDDLETPEDNKEDSSPLAHYREDAMQRGRIPFVLEMNRETLTAQIVVLSEDEVNMEEAEAQWVSFLKDFLHSEGFVISSEMHTIVISSRPLEMSENDYLESLINDASDVFGVQPDESLFEPFFIPLDNQMVKKLSPQIQ